MANRQLIAGVEPLARVTFVDQHKQVRFGYVFGYHYFGNDRCALVRTLDRQESWVSVSDLTYRA